MKKKSICVIILICISPFIIKAQTNKSQILILGTSHLQQMKDFEPNMLDKVIAKLDTFNFDVICIEKMSGELLYDIKNRNNEVYQSVINGRWGKPYLAIADTVQKVKQVEFLDAEDSVLKLLKKKRLTLDERKMLFYNYLAITDIPSAALQYQYIKDRNDLFSSDFDRYLIHQINKEVNTNSEFYTLALPLAFHQKQDRIESINNFQDEALLMKYYPGFSQDCNKHSEKLSAISKMQVYQKMATLSKQGINDNDLSALYSFINSKEYMTKDYHAQWKIWLETNFSSQSDRARFSLWEMRNLQIAANILNVVSQHSGEKIIVIIGSSHKSFLEKYLKQMEDIELLKYE